MKKLFLAALLMATPAVAQNAMTKENIKENINWLQFMARHDLTWEKLPAQWQEGAFIGNGLLGAMIYLSEDKQSLRWDIGRSDVQDRGGRIPVGVLSLKTVGQLQGGTMRLDLWNAEASGTLKTDKGEIKFRSFTHASDLVTAIEIETTDGERAAQFNFAPGLAANARKIHRKEPLTDADKNPEPQPGEANGTKWIFQPLQNGDHATAWREMANGNRRALYLSTEFFEKPGGGILVKREATQDTAARRVENAAKNGLEKLSASHRAWWHSFWPQSFVSLPDTRMESFYWIQMYKLGSATRADRPAIDLMGPWFRSTPWPMIWWNLNIQLTYWPVYASNRLELGESLTRMIDAGQGNLINNVPEKWRADSAGIGRVSSYDLRGGAGKELGNLTWALHNYWLQYRYSMDEAKLRALFPLLKRSVNYMVHNLVPGDDGKLHFPVDISPEYPTAAADTNYNLALLRWGLQTLIESDAKLKTNDAQLPQWKETLEKLAPYPVDEKTGLMIGKDVPLAESHRHFSHMLMIYPLYTMNWEQPENRALIDKSLNHWIGFKGALQGYSYTGSAAMKAQMGKGDDAAQLLNQFLDSYVKANTMYLEAGPVIETPLAGAASIHEMLLQSWGGKIRVFPAVPDAWKDVTIHNMRAEGGFLVSASRRNGKTQWVRITSLAGAPCRVQVDFLSKLGDLRLLGREDRRILGSPEPAFPPYAFLKLKRGESTLLFNPDVKSVPTVEPVPAQEWRTNFYGSRKTRAIEPVAPSANGSFDLTPRRASFGGENLFVQKSGDVENIGHWIGADDSALWNIKAAPGRYKLFVRYATPGGGNKFIVTVGDAKLSGTVQPTGNYDTFREFEIGTIDIKNAGLTAIEVRAENLKGALFNLANLRLEPIK